MNIMLKNRYAICAVGIAIVYVIFEVIQVNHFLSTILRGDNYYRYNVLYLPALFVVFCLYSARAGSFERLGWSLLFGCVAGYIVGLFASVFMAFLMGDGATRIANSIRDMKYILAVLVAPALYMSWLYGGLLALFIYLVKKMVTKSRCQVLH